MKNKILEVKNLRKTYHDSNGEIEAIKNINFDIYEKEFVSIVGPSGCGKSTLLSLLANILIGVKKILLLDICYKQILFFPGETF